MQGDVMLRGLVAFSACLAACNQPVEVGLHYQLKLTPADVVRIETRVSVASPDTRMFFADQPYRAVAEGVGYEVRDLSGNGERELLITHDATIGFQPTAAFIFTLLPPVSTVAPPLDISAQAFGTDAELGRSAVVSAKFGKGSTVDLIIADTRCGGKVCAGSEVCCGGSCVTVDSNAAHCGGCGVMCGAAETCSGGACRCEGGSGCQAGSACCPGVGCVDPASDAFNCGSCGHACNPGETCSAGKCGCASNSGKACNAGELCCSTTGCTATGSCSCNGTACDTPNTCCNSTSCRDLATDPTNCGSCGKVCAAGLTCSAGKCKCGGAVCAASDTCCAASGCKNLQNDPANCNGCGIACGSGQICDAGKCVCGTSGSGCGPNQPLCCATTSTCVNPNINHENCGGCGVACKVREVCDTGACRCNNGPACSTGTRCCPDTGGCVDVSNNQANCGGCNLPCTNGQICVGGACTTMNCNCPGALSCCGGGCIDQQTDVKNCGGCGKACGVAQLCCKGQCISQSNDNCGACGSVCGPIPQPTGGTVDSICCGGCSTMPQGTCIPPTQLCQLCPPLQ